MEKLINDFEIGLFLWQLFLLILFGFILYFFYRLLKKIIK